MIWVTAEDVVAIHSRIIQVSGGIDGLRDRAGLEAAIAAPLQSFGGEDLFPTDIEKIARIVRTPLCKISSTGEIEQRFRLN